MNMWEKASAFLHLLRPHHWLKNVLLLLPLIFGGKFFNAPAVASAAWALLAFCLTASAVYTLNDAVDAERDRAHPKKMHRPIASGKVKQIEAIILFLLLCIAAGLIAIFLVKSWVFLVAILVYLLLNSLYSTSLKHLAILDIMLVSFFYLLRVYVGAEVVDVPVSGWLFLCIFYFSLFLIAGKRRAELISAANARKVLKQYTTQFLEAVMLFGVVLGSFSYALYVITTNRPLGSVEIFISSFILLRLLYMSLVQNRGEEPEMIFLQDPAIWVAVLIWGVMNIVTTYNLIPW